MMDINLIITRIKALSEERVVPSNVRRSLREALNALEDNNNELSVRLNTATSLLDEISNDPNLAQYTRTEVWHLATMLESVKC